MTRTRGVGGHSDGKAEATSEMEKPSTDSQSISERPAYQPIHPSVRPLLDAQYVAFHDEYVQYVEPEQMKPWNKNVRTRYTWPYAGSPLVEVGKVEDIRPCGDFDIRVFTPASDPPRQGWPLLIWFHGGGFAAGNIDSDNDVCSFVCREVGCVVANVDYRLAPEHPFPAAVDDVAAVLRWSSSDLGTTQLRTDRSRIAIAGSSAGGNLAAVGALLAVEMGIPLALQLLVVPVTDNSATLQTTWSAYPNAPWLTGPRMTFYRNLYLEDQSMARQWKASPINAPTTLIQKLPKAFIAVAGQDMLSTEGLAYATLLTENGVPTQARTYEGMPHGMLALSGVLTKGRQAMQDIVEFLQSNLNSV